MTVADDLFDRMVEGRESFWTAVYPPFMSHDITRADVREVLEKGLERIGGSYKGLVRLFNINEREYRRFRSISSASTAATSRSSITVHLSRFTTQILVSLGADFGRRLSRRIRRLSAENYTKHLWRRVCSNPIKTNRFELTSRCPPERARQGCAWRCARH